MIWEYSGTRQLTEYLEEMDSAGEPGGNDFLSYGKKEI